MLEAIVPTFEHAGSLGFAFHCSIVPPPYLDYLLFVFHAEHAFAQYGLTFGGKGMGSKPSLDDDVFLLTVNFHL